MSNKNVQDEGSRDAALFSQKKNDLTNNSLRIVLLLGLLLAAFIFRAHMQSYIFLFCQRSVQAFIGDFHACHMSGPRIMLLSFLHSAFFFWLPPRQWVAAVECAGYFPAVFFSLAGSLGASLIIFWILRFLLQDFPTPIRKAWNRWNKPRQYVFLSGLGFLFPGGSIVLCICAALAGAKTAIVSAAILISQLPFFLLYTSHATIYHSLVPVWLLWSFRFIGLSFLCLAIFIKRECMRKW